MLQMFSWRIMNVCIHATYMNCIHLTTVIVADRDIVMRSAFHLLTRLYDAIRLVTKFSLLKELKVLYSIYACRTKRFRLNFVCKWFNNKAVLAILKFKLLNVWYIISLLLFVFCPNIRIVLKSNSLCLFIWFFSCSSIPV